MNTLFKVLVFLDRPWVRFLFGAVLMAYAFYPASLLTLRALMWVAEHWLNVDFAQQQILGLVFASGALAMCWLSQLIAFIGGFWHSALLDIGSRLWVRIKAK